jgi:hypothetical protein
VQQQVHHMGSALQIEVRAPPGPVDDACGC